MPFRPLLAGLALATVATVSQAGPFRRYSPPAYHPPYLPTYQPLYPTSVAPPTAVMPAGAIVTDQSPVVTSIAEQVSGYASVVTPAAVTAGAPVPGFAPVGGPEGDGLDEVNAKRAARGLRPFIRDEGLTQAARTCARFRAANGLFGHTPNDFAFVPPGAFAASAGCAAYPAGYGWMSCCVYDNYTYAGAAWVTGRDGRRYMHLFVR